MVRARTRGSTGKFDAADGSARSRHGGESGQALLIAILCLTLLLGLVGLAADVGLLRAAKINLQTVADSAAVAGASEVKYGTATAAARTDATKNGFTDGVNGATLTVLNPPQNGPHTGDVNYVEIIAAQPKSAIFMNLFNVGLVTLRARAVAGLGSGTGCIYTLDPTASNAILLNGNGTIQAQCGVIDDSNSSSAMRFNGNVTFSVESIGIVGNYVTTGHVIVNPTPVTNIAPEPDPLSYLPKPTVGSCTYNNYSTNSNATLSPGVYCGGITLNGSARGTFNPGLYILNNGGLTLNGNTTITGTGVTFYLTGTSTLTLNGGNGVSLVAPTTGTYAGILFFQDPADTRGATFNGNNSTTLQGALYFPTAALTVNGTGSTAAYTILVASTITFNGSGTFNDNYSTLPNGSPIKAAHLTE